MNKETKEQCSHNFDYSHKEYSHYEEQVSGYIPGQTSAMIYKKVDVVVCTKCGEVRRN